jgi:uncharacterized protein YfaP (DUF2135 family)
VRALALLALLAACARPASVPPAPAEPVTPGVTVTLRWSAAVDLDLYVTDPSLETVYFGNPRTASGGRLERDARCADGATGERVERARWERPPSGRYRIAVDFIERCAGRGDEAAYDLTVDVDGRRIDVPGRARLGVRDARVLEFTVP